ncbi:MAG: response regulator [Candidatus Helarchaeota archaeon]
MAKKAKILVVDDDKGITETLQYILDELDFYVAIANDGYSAIDKVKKSQFDLILLDIKMPEINGLETLREIKKLRQSTKVIMMTGYSVEDLLEKALEEGACNIVHKPFSMKNVLKLIENEIKNKNLK